MNSWSIFEIWPTSYLDSNDKAEVDRRITHLNSLFENGSINEEATIK